MVIALLALACGGGQRHPSEVTDARILSIVAEPPEAQPGETVDISVLVANPLERELEVLIWTCGMYEGECAESMRPFTDWAIVASPIGSSLRHDGVDVIAAYAAEQARVTRSVPSEVSELLDYVDPIPVLLYALACEPGLCPLIEEVKDALEDNNAGSRLEKKLADPTLWMHQLPMDGVSLAIQQFMVSNADETRNHNPIFDPRFVQGRESVLRVPAGGELEVAFFVDDPDAEKVYGYGYTTIGSFEKRRVTEEDNAIRNYLLAPSQGGEGRVYMVFEDRDGGAAIWTRPIEIY